MLIESLNTSYFIIYNKFVKYYYSYFSNGEIKAQKT